MSLFQLVKKARRGFLTALLPPDILNVFKMPLLMKVLINQAFLRRFIQFGAGRRHGSGFGRHIAQHRLGAAQSVDRGGGDASGIACAFSAGV